jgi:peptidoglycan/xylan/chitin deacetylase (PgdA/CDA1 family)
MSHSSGFGPDERERVVVLSFDNLGEASPLERGTWEAPPPLGQDPSVTVALPRLLDELDRHDLSATFFVEAINCEMYPSAVREIVDRGHELGVHGWRHEPWAELPATHERALLKRSTDAFASLGIEACAFRPPGGEPTAQTPALLRELGYAWYSPAGDALSSSDTVSSGDAVSSSDGLVSVPFDWELVDAYHLMERFGELRSRRGDERAALTPEAVTSRLTRALDGGRAAQTVIMHPFLMLDDRWWSGAQAVLASIAALGRDGRAWVVPGRELASWLNVGAR